PGYVTMVKSADNTKQENTFNETFLTGDISRSFIELSQLDTPDVLIKKEYFSLMTVIGQFNNGFILTELDIPDGRFLVVIDQHAADEIYNFETLRKTFTLKKQKLLVPVPLNLTPT